MFLERILVLFDQPVISPQLLSQAAKLAIASDASVTLLHVLDSSTLSLHEQFIDPLQWHMIKTEAEVSLNKVTERLQEHGLQAQKAILENWTVESILKYIRDNQVGLVAVDKQGASIGEKLHMLLQHIDIPMLIAPAKEQLSDEITLDAYQKILVPLDGSQRAEFALPIATNLARITGAELLLAHVVHKPEMLTRTPASTEDSELLDRLVERNQTEGMKYLEELTARADVKAEPRLVVSENVSVALHNLVEQERVNLVVLSAHGYSSEPQWPYGSIAYNLINYIDEAILIIQDIPAGNVQVNQRDIPIREKFSRS